MCQAGTLVVDQGAAHNGNVTATCVVNDVLMLAGATAATFSGIETQFTNFTTIVEGRNANWTRLGAAIQIAGGNMIIRQDASLTLDGSQIGAVTIRLDAGATLTADADLTAPTSRFANGGRETLILSSTDPFTSTISGFRISDTIDLATAVTTVSTIGGTIMLLDNQTVVEILPLDGNFTASQFALTPDNRGGTDITRIASARATNSAPSHAAPAFTSWPQDGLVHFALFGMPNYLG